MSSKPNITVRNMRVEDAEALNAILTDPRVMRTLVMMPSMPVSATADYIKDTSPGKHRFVAEVDGEVAGAGTLTRRMRPRLQHTGRLGMYVAHRFWGKGVGSALMAHLLEIADNWLGLLRVQLEVFAENETAVHLYQKFGFEIEALSKMAVFGDNGRFHDEYVMARIPSHAPVSTMRKVVSVPGRGDIVDVTIRPPLPEDAADLYKMFSHPLVARTTNQIPSQEISLTQQRLGETSSAMHRFVAEALLADGSQTVCGMATLYQPEQERLMHTAGLGMAVRPGFWGLGIGTQLMDALLDIADNWLGLRRVFLTVNPDNPGAIRLYEKSGFEREGTLRLYSFGEGTYNDAHLMSRLR